MNCFCRTLRACLASNGPPGEDGGGGLAQLTLHGRIANRPADAVEVSVSPDPPYELTVRGEVEEGALFCPHLRLTTAYVTAPGSNRLVIHDIVENRSAQAAEMQMLYHCNFGPPFHREAGPRLQRRRAIRRRRRAARRGVDSYETYAAGPVLHGFPPNRYIFTIFWRTAAAASAGRPAGSTAGTGPWPCASAATNCPVSRSGRTPGPSRTATSPVWSRRRTIRILKGFCRRGRADPRAAAGGRGGAQAGAWKSATPRRARPPCWPISRLAPASARARHPSFIMTRRRRSRRF